MEDDARRRERFRTALGHLARGGALLVFAVGAPLVGRLFRLENQGLVAAIFLPWIACLLAGPVVTTHGLVLLLATSVRYRAGVWIAVAVVGLGGCLSAFGYVVYLVWQLGAVWPEVLLVLLGLVLVLVMCFVYQGEMEER